MANAKKHSLPKGLQTPWAGNPPGSLRGKAKSSTKQPKAQGITPGKPAYGINVTNSRKHKSAVTGASRNTPSGQGLLSGKAKRQVQ